MLGSRASLPPPPLSLPRSLILFPLSWESAVDGRPLVRCNIFKAVNRSAPACRMIVHCAVTNRSRIDGKNDSINQVRMLLASAPDMLAESLCLPTMFSVRFPGVVL